MNLRFLNLFALVAVALGCQAVFLCPQSVGQSSRKMATPMAGLGRHSSDGSPLGRVDESISQTIALRITGQSDVGQSSSASLDQVESSQPGGSRAPLSKHGPTSGAGARRLINSDVYTNPSHTEHSSKLSTSALLPSTNGQRTPLGGSSSTTRSRNVPERGQFGSLSQSARRQKILTGTDNSELQQNDLGLSGSSLTTGAGGWNSLERLSDPFLAPSTAGFEGFTNKRQFDQPCGDACSLRTEFAGWIFGTGIENERAQPASPMSRSRRAGISTASRHRIVPSEPTWSLAPINLPPEPDAVRVADIVIFV